MGTAAGQRCVISLCDTVKFRVKWDKRANQERWATRATRWVSQAFLGGGLTFSIFLPSSRVPFDLWRFHSKTPDDYNHFILFGEMTQLATQLRILVSWKTRLFVLMGKYVKS